MNPLKQLVQQLERNASSSLAPKAPLAERMRDLSPQPERHEDELPATSGAKNGGQPNGNEDGGNAGAKQVAPRSGSGAPLAGVEETEAASRFGRAWRGRSDAERRRSRRASAPDPRQERYRCRRRGWDPRRSRCGGAPRGASRCAQGRGADGRLPFAPNAALCRAKRRRDAPRRDTPRRDAVVARPVPAHRLRRHSARPERSPALWPLAIEVRVRAHSPRRRAKRAAALAPSQTPPLPGAGEGAPAPAPPKADTAPAPSPSGFEPDAASSLSGDAAIDTGENVTEIAKQSYWQATVEEETAPAEPAALKPTEAPALPPGVVFFVEDPALGH